MVLLDGIMDFWEVGAPGVLQVAGARATVSSSLEHSCTQPGSLPPQPPSCSTKCTNSHLLVPFHTHCQPPRMLGVFWSLLRCQRHILVVLHLPADTPIAPLLHYRSSWELVAGVPLVTY